MHNLLEILIFTLRNFTKFPILRYFGICNVLHIWHIRAIPTYRVYRLYDRNGRQLNMGYEAREWACILGCGLNPTHEDRLGPTDSSCLPHVDRLENEAEFESTFLQARPGLLMAARSPLPSASLKKSQSTPRKGKAHLLASLARQPLPLFVWGGGGGLASETTYWHVCGCQAIHMS